MADQLKISIIGTLNTGKSIGEINTAIKGIEKKLNKIKLNIEINDKTLNTLNNFNKQMKSISTTAKNTGKVIESAMMPDGTKVTRTFFDGMKGEFQETVNRAKELGTTIKSNTNAQSQENKLVQQQIALRKQLVSLYASGKNITKEQLQETARLVNNSNNENINQARLSVDRLRNAENLNRRRETELQYEQRINTQIDQQRIKQREMLDLYKRQAQIQVNALRSNPNRTISSQQDQQLTNYLNSVNALNTSTPRLQQNMRGLALDFREVSSQTQTASRHAMTFGQMLSTAMEKFPIKFQVGVKLL